MKDKLTADDPAKWDGCFTYPQDVEDFIRAKRYLIDLFRIVAPQCEPMNTLAGLVSQIDNFIAGQRDKLADAQKSVAEPEVIEGDGVKVLPDGVYWVDNPTANSPYIVNVNNIVHRAVAKHRYIRIPDPPFPPRPPAIPPKPELVLVWKEETSKPRWAVVDGDMVRFVDNGLHHCKSACWKVESQA